MRKLQRKPGLFAVILLLISLVLGAARSWAQDGAVTMNISALEDKNREWSAQQVLSMPFQQETSSTLNYGLTKSAYWLKIKITNNGNDDDLLFKIQNGNMTDATMYDLPLNGNSRQIGDLIPYSRKEYQTQFPVYRIRLPRGTTGEYLLRLVTNNVMDIPMSAGREVTVLESINKDQLFFGIYFGIIMVMFFYNIFIYLTVRDKNYLYYVMYILAVGLLQASLKGYASKFLWPESTFLKLHTPNILIALSGVFSIFFVFNFLNVKQFSKVLYYILWGTNIAYFAGITISLTGNFIMAQQMLQGIAGLVALTMMVAGITIYRRGYRPALFFTISWSFFLSGVVTYILKDAGALPFNNFTSNAILIGSSLEVALLSFALADKINTYRKEKEESQAIALEALKENEKIITEQNIVLERRVNERTHELNLSNQELNKALKELKEAETQLVESEKMASLGQLTAGIAHEINNPINFVTSNVKPLNRDVHMLLDTVDTIEKLVYEDISLEEKKRQIEEYKSDIDYDYLKDEIGQLLHGIGEGASRTAEIVKGLRIFSRLDEDDLKKADINEGLDSTLIIANNLFSNLIKVEKHYSNIPLIECYPGKLNQVFLNMISNAVYAIKKRFDDKEGGTLTIKTYLSTDNYLAISIADNGTGMDDNTKKKLFEPFFTTKDVGEGTGLGMSIAYNTIIKHNGVIEINSELGKGTEFIIKLPLIQK